MLKLCLLFLVICCYEPCFSQKETKIDIILEIDNNTPICCISRVQLKAVGADEKYFDASYYPGNLSLNSKDYAIVLSPQTEKIYLKFNYDEYIGGIQRVYNYEIEIKKQWLDDEFNILKIYNLDKKRYKGKIQPLDSSKAYNYELDSPTHSFRLVRKK